MSVFIGLIQERFLSALIEKKAIVTIYLMNGIKLTGKIVGASKNTILLSEPVPQMIYKSRVSTIVEG
jgi:RNA chaperone Hfq